MDITTEIKPTIKVKLPQEVIDFIKMNGSMEMVEGQRYYQPPQFWYKKAYMGNDYVFEIHYESPLKQQANGHN